MKTHGTKAALTEFRQWCAITLFSEGDMPKTPFIGFATEARIGGSEFIRLDVPATGRWPERTLFLGPGAIQQIDVLIEEEAREFLETWWG